MEDLIKKYSDGTQETEIILQKCIKEPPEPEFWKDMLMKNLASFGNPEKFLRDFIKYIPKDCWGWLWSYQKVSESFIEDFIGLVDWNVVWRHQRVSEAFIERHMSRARWRYILAYQDLSNDFLRKHAKTIGWSKIVEYRELSEDLIREYINSNSPSRSCWFNLLEKSKLSEQFLREFANKIPTWSWQNVWLHQTVSEDFIEDFKHMANWNFIWSRQKVSDKFIEKHMEHACWGYICRHQTLSEEFMDKYADKLSWESVCFHQKLSTNLMDKWYMYLYWVIVSHRQTLTPEFIDKYASRLSWGHVSQYQPLNGALVDKYSSRIVWQKLALNKTIEEDVLNKYANKIDWAIVLLNRDISPDLVRKHFRSANFCSHDVGILVKGKSSKITRRPNRQVSNQEIRRYIKNLLHTHDPTQSLGIGSIYTSSFRDFWYGAYINIDIHNNIDKIKDILAAYNTNTTTCKEMIASNLYHSVQHDTKKSGYLCGMLFKNETGDRKGIARKVLRNTNRLLRRISISFGIKAPKLHIQHRSTDNVYAIAANLPPDSPWIRSKVMIHILAWALQFGVKNAKGKWEKPNTLSNFVKYSCPSGWKRSEHKDGLTWAQVRKLIRNKVDMKIKSCPHNGVVTGTRRAISLGLLK